MYYAVKHDEDDLPMVIGQFIDEDDARSTFALVFIPPLEVFTAEEMRADPTLNMELARWEGDREELERRFLIREWILHRDSLRTEISDLRGSLQWTAVPAARFADDDPTLPLAIAAHAALLALQEALDSLRPVDADVPVGVGAST